MPDYGQALNAGTLTGTATYLKKEEGLTLAYNGSKSFAITLDGVKLPGDSTETVTATLTAASKGAKAQSAKLLY